MVVFHFGSMFDQSTNGHHWQGEVIPECTAWDDTPMDNSVLS
jgi:hypothetical protein